MWGRGPKGNKATCLALGWLSVTSPDFHKQIGPFWCWFPGGWACLCSRTLWISPTNSPVRLAVSLAVEVSIGFYSQILRLSFPSWNTGMLGLSHSLVAPPSLSTHKCGTTQSTRHHLAQPVPPATTLSQVLSAPAAISAPPTGLDECFFFTPWLSDFHTVQFSGSFSCFCF